MNNWHDPRSDSRKTKDDRIASRDNPVIGRCRICGEKGDIGSDACGCEQQASRLYQIDQAEKRWIKETMQRGCTHTYRKEEGKNTYETYVMRCTICGYREWEGTKKATPHGITETYKL